jgi:hypothetical protein
VWFSSKVTFARVISPFAAGASTKAVPANTSASAGSNFIDDLVQKKLDALNLPASGPCTDEQFIRRAYLDAAGILPQAADVDAFVADRSADKRLTLIDRLLSRPEYVDYWTYKWSDLLLVSSRKLSGPALTSFYNWIRNSVETNKPWDRFARDILTAQGSNLENGAVNYWVLHKEPIDQSETTTQAFMDATTTRWRSGPRTTTTRWRTSMRASGSKTETGRARCWRSRQRRETSNIHDLASRYPHVRWTGTSCL